MTVKYKPDTIKAQKAAERARAAVGAGAKVLEMFRGKRAGFDWHQVHVEG